jgi:hypothetical protein
MSFRIAFAEHCAWRAAYVYINERQVARIGFDPGIGKSEIFGAFPCGWWTRPCDGERFPRLFEFRFRVPFSSYRHNEWYIRSAWRDWLKSFDGRFAR